jgi:hypothetical protein
MALDAGATTEVADAGEPAASSPARPVQSGAADPDPAKRDPKSARQHDAERNATERRGDKRPGKLRVTTKPYWGLVSIDGSNIREETPALIELPPGKHKLVVSHPPKQKRVERVVVVRSGELTVEAINFE